MTDHRTLRKDENALYRARSAAEFREMFAGLAGVAVETLVFRLLPESSVCAILLGGSIPLGIGTEASDVDLIAVTEGDTVPLAVADEKMRVAFVGRSLDAAESLFLGTTVVLIEGVEVDIAFVRLAETLSTLERLERGDVAIPPDRGRQLARLRSGWVLWQSPLFDSTMRPALRSLAFDVHACVNALVLGAKYLEDAFYALPRNVHAALHLGRCCVDRCFAGFLASRARPFIGERWIRYFESCIESLTHGLSAGQRARLQGGIALMFPACTDSSDEARHYLNLVEQFARDVRAIVELDLRYRIALGVCPQFNSILRPRA
ncbi:MAG: hypothetical protein WDO56_11845 [Gammaproteobacteria bacterium]